jgi:hypothetical protein
MDLANMRKQGVRRLVAFCLNDACRHQALIEVWSYPANTEIAYFKRRVVCAECGARGNKIDLRIRLGARQCRGMTDAPLAGRLSRQGSWHH